MNAFDKLLLRSFLLVAWSIFHTTQVSHFFVSRNSNHMGISFLLRLAFLSTTFWEKEGLFTNIFMKILIHQKWNYNVNSLHFYRAILWWKIASNFLWMQWWSKMIPLILLPAKMLPIKRMLKRWPWKTPIFKKKFLLPCVCVKQNPFINSHLFVIIHINHQICKINKLFVV